MGLITLALAIVLTVGWLRSRSHGDVFWMKLKGEYFTLRSVNSGLQLHHEKSLLALSLNTLAIDGSTVNSELRLERAIERSPWWQTWRGFDAQFLNGLSYSAIDPALPKAKVSAPYWSIVFPLTVLSAYLLLSKSRQPTKPQSSLESLLSRPTAVATNK